LGLSQRQLGLRIKKEDGEKISPHYLNHIERERRCTPSQHLILHFARALKPEPDYLFGLAQISRKDMVKGMERSSSGDDPEVFCAFRRILKDKK
jgi:transcriptional regulator with XRE-family HTH domain